MPILVTASTGFKLDLNAEDRLHWVIGRSGNCDLVLDDPGISRYHATVFRVGEDYYVLDHSFNGTHLCLPRGTPDTDSRVPSFSSLNLDANQESRTTSHSQAKDTAEIDVSEILAAGKNDAEDDKFDVHKSHAELHIQELRSQLPRMVGYLPHNYATTEDMEPILQMIYSAQGADTISSMGRLLHIKQQIVFVGEEQHYTTVVG